MLTYTLFKNETTSQWITFVHGASASSAVWKFQIEFFKRYYNVLVLDFIGYGEQTAENDNENIYSFEFVATEVIKVLNKEKIKHTHFIGTSMGNIIIRQIMETEPERVNAVVMTSAILNLNFMISLVLYLVIFLEKFVPHKMLYSLSVRVSFPMPCNKPSRELFRKNIHNFSQDMYRLWLKLAQENFALMHFFNLVGLRSKVLFVNGNQDYIFLPFVKKFVKANATAEIRIIERSGHGVNIDKKDIYNNEVLDYLRQIESQNRLSRVSS